MQFAATAAGPPAAATAATAAAAAIYIILYIIPSYKGASRGSPLRGAWRGPASQSGRSISDIFSFILLCKAFFLLFSAFAASSLLCGVCWSTPRTQNCAVCVCVYYTSKAGPPYVSAVYGCAILENIIMGGPQGAPAAPSKSCLRLPNPLVYLDIAVGKKNAGRLVFQAR